MNASRPVLLHIRHSLLLITGLAGLAACGPAAEENAADDANASNEVSFNLPAAVPLPEPPMDRFALLSAVAEAASATAAGRDDASAQAALDGRQFELRIRFGCSGPAPELQESVLGWSFDQEDRTLRVRAMPTISANDAIVSQVLGRLSSEAIEAVEGFWIPRPWLLQPVCPAAARPTPPPAPASVPAQQPPARTQRPGPAPAEDPQESEAPPPAWPKVGIAHFFTETDPRTRRRQMRPYEIVETLEPNQSVGAEGFNLVLSGRLRALPGRRVIACVSAGPDNPPECIISAQFDRVWIERPGTRKILAEWGSG